MNELRGLPIVAYLALSLGIISLAVGYPNFSSGEKSLWDWLLLPTAMFMVFGGTLYSAHKMKKFNEGPNA